MPNDYDVANWEVKRNGDGIIASNELLGVSFEGPLDDFNQYLDTNDAGPFAFPEGV